MPMHRKKKGKPNEIDAIIGQNLRKIRLVRGLSQEKLALAVNVTFQQIQKYERGTNRISAGNLYHLACALEVSVLDFYDGLDYMPQTLLSPLIREDIAFIALLNSFQNPGIKKALRHLVRQIGREVG